MPVDRKKMNALKEEYGPKKGEEIYYAMEAKERGKKRATRKNAGGKRDYV